VTGPAQPAQPWDAPIAALAMQCMAVRTTLRQAGLTGDLNVPAELRSLAEAVAALTTAQRRQRPQVPRWDQLTGAALAEAMAALRQWVNGTLLADFPSTVPRECWPAHRDVVWELSALHGEWQRIHAGDQADLAGLLDWLDRWRPRAEARIGAALEGCTRSSCQPGSPPPGRRPRVA